MNSCLNEELQEFLKANTQSNEVEHEDFKVIDPRKIILRPKKVVSKSLQRQKTVQKKNITIKQPIQNSKQKVKPKDRDEIVFTEPPIDEDD